MLASTLKLISINGRITTAINNKISVNIETIDKSSAQNLYELNLLKMIYKFSWPFLLLLHLLNMLSRPYLDKVKVARPINKILYPGSLQGEVTLK